MNDKVYIVFRNALYKEVHAVYQFKENALAEAAEKNRDRGVVHYTVGAFELTPFIPCGRGPCWSPEGHAGDCMADE